MTVMRILFGGVLLFVALLDCGPAKASTKTALAQAQTEMTMGSGESQTPLMQAISNTDTKAFQSLLDHADVNASDDRGWTALMLATRFGESSFVKALLKKGADVNAQTKNGLTALIIAGHMLITEDKADIEIPKMLIERGADVNAKSKEGMTPLMSAAGSGRLKLVKLLLEKGAKINDEDARHATALTYALRGKHGEDTVEYLKSAGATGPEPEPEAKSATVTSVDQRPAPLNFPQPQYTELARQNKVEGVVIVYVLVGADGSVKRARVVKGLPDGLTDQAIRAAYALRFKPAVKGGQPVAFWQSVYIEFRLGK